MHAVSANCGINDPPVHLDSSGLFIKSEHDDDYNLFKEKLMARIPKISTPLGNIPLAHDG